MFLSGVHVFIFSFVVAVFFFVFVVAAVVIIVTYNGFWGSSFLTFEGIAVGAYATAGLVGKFPGPFVAEKIEKENAE